MASQKQRNFSVPSGGQRKRLAKQLRLDRSRLPIVVNFAIEDDSVRGVIVMGREGRHWTLALDPGSIRPVPNLHSGGVTLGPEDLGVLWTWIASLEPVFQRAIEASTLVLPRRRCLELIEPTIELSASAGSRAVAAAIDRHGTKLGLRIAIDQLSPMLVEVPTVPPELSYELAARGHGVLMDRELGVVVVPGGDFDMLVPMGLVFHRIVPLLAGPTSTIMRYFEQGEPNAEHLIEVHSAIPYEHIVRGLRGAGAMFVQEFDGPHGQDRWQRVLAR